jgi:Ni,Fe-hydrogenase III component G
LKLDNRIKTLEIGGHTVKVGKLTMAAAVEIESYLETLESPLEKMERAKILTQIDKDAAIGVVDSLTQDLAFWPPDAIGALCDRRFLTRGKFGRAFVAAMVRAYNGHFEPSEVDRIANNATLEDVFAIQPIALGVTSDPKDLSGLGAATQPQASESSGGE